MFWHDTFLELTTKLKHLKIWKTLRWECGSILIFTAVAIPIFLGLMGIGYDVGNLYMHKARLQNIADAAALAGARAFADSQAYNDVTKVRDKVDQKITISSYKPSVTYSVNDSATERIKNHGTEASPHPNADEEADKYIYNNLISLGNNVSTDLYSHYALLSKEIHPRTFYRVGLTEEVDLHFLPIIRGIGKTQSVGVEAIVLLSEDTGQEIPATVFSNLFTYTGNLHVINSNKKDKGKDKIQTIFDGQMFYTGDSDNSSNYFSIEDPLPNLYSATDINKTNNPQPHSAITLDAYMPFFNEKLQQAKELNACVELDMSQEADRNLFNRNNINKLQSNLYKKQEIDINGNLMYTIKYTDEFNITKEFTYSIDESKAEDDIYKYYSIDDKGKPLYCLKYELTDGPTIRVPSYIDEHEDGFPCVIDNKEYQYYVVDGSKDKIYYNIDPDKNINRHYVYFVTKKADTTEKMVIFDAYWTGRNPNGTLNGGNNGDPKVPNFPLYPWGKDLSDNCGTHFKYSTENKKNVNYRLINFRAFKEEKFTTQRTPRILTLNANVFHLVNNNSTNQDINLTIDGNITGHGNPSEPIYIFVDNGNTLNITVKKDKDSGRPIVIIYQGIGRVNILAEQQAKFHGTIYAPQALVHTNFWSNSRFEGNIVARDIESIGDAKNGTASFVQKNHLESDTDLYGKIIQYAQNDTNGEAHLFSNATDLSKPPSNTFNSSWENWYNYVGKDRAENWFYNTLNNNQRVAFWRTWDAAHRPPNADEYGNLFPDQGPYHAWYDQDGWKNPENGWYFTDWSPSDDEKNDAKQNKAIEHIFDTKIRLINPRLEANPFKS